MKLRTTLQIRLLLSASILLFSCTSEPPAQPMCRVEAQQRESTAGGAACLIRIDKWLVTTANRHSEQLDIPGGEGQADETAQCTAHRNTWEQTGFNVEVGRPLGHTDSGLQVYQCYLPPTFTPELKVYPVPAWGQPGIQSIQLSNPFELQLQDWQRGDELIALRKWFNQADTRPQRGPQEKRGTTE